MWEMKTESEKNLKRRCGVRFDVHLRFCCRTGTVHARQFRRHRFTDRGTAVTCSKYSRVTHFKNNFKRYISQWTATYLHHDKKLLAKERQKCTSNAMNPPRKSYQSKRLIGSGTNIFRYLHWSTRQCDSNYMILILFCPGSQLAIRGFNVMTSVTLLLIYGKS